METLARQAYEAVEEGDARIADRCNRIQHSQRLGPDEFSRVPTRFRYGSINRDRTPARIVPRFASFEICAAEVEEGGFVLGRVRERGGDRDRL